MIILPAQTRWGRDPVIQDMINHFDQPNKNSFDKINAKELEAITDQVKLCGDNFTYAARNYFWLANKKAEDTLFKLWESQEMILDKIMMLRARGKAQKLIVLKARQLGASTLIEALVAWTAMFFPNTNSIVASYDEDHAAYLFGIMLHIYDHMPWWLRPMKENRRGRSGMKFDNPNEDERRLNPGMNSEIWVQYATQYTGIGQGKRVTCAHMSELGQWQQQKVAKAAVEGDMREALTEESPLAFAIIESKGHGAGSYYHSLYKTQKELGDGKQEWFTMFLPWFFERSRFISPEKGWHPQKPELELKDRAQRDWVQCNNAPCSMWHEATLHNKAWDGELCPFCNVGTLHPFIIPDGQLRFIYGRRINSESDPDALKKLRQELASTDTEAWQLSGHQIFPESVQDYVEQNKREPRARGFIDAKGTFHGVMLQKLDPVSRLPIGSKCWAKDCDLDHSFDECPLLIWKFTEHKASYAIGVDIAEGLGGASDNSVIWVEKLGDPTQEAEQVAMFVSNEITPLDLAWPVVCLGRMYNEALIGIEINKFDTCATEVVTRYQYPNCYRGVDQTGIYQTQSRKMHWDTKEGSKYRLWHTGLKSLKAKSWIIRSEQCLSEMKTFQKEDPSATNGSAMRGFKDDILMAGMIAHYIGQGVVWDDNTDTGRGDARLDSPADQPYNMLCKACGNAWKTDDPKQWTDNSNGTAPGCPKCHSIMLSGSGPKSDPVVENLRGIYAMLNQESVALGTGSKYDDL